MDYKTKMNNYAQAKKTRARERIWKVSGCGLYSYFCEKNLTLEEAQESLAWFYRNTLFEDRGFEDRDDDGDLMSFCSRSKLYEIELMSEKI